MSNRNSIVEPSGASGNAGNEVRSEDFGAFDHHLASAGFQLAGQVCPARTETALIGHIVKALKFTDYCERCSGL